MSKGSEKKLAQISRTNATETRQAVDTVLTELAQPTNTPSTTRMPTDVSVQISTAYYTTANANARSCPELHCEIVAGLYPNTEILVSETVTGAVVSGSDTWYAFLHEGTSAYIHSSLAREALTPTATSNTSTHNQTESEECSVAGGNINIRSGPGTNYGVIGALEDDNLETVKGQNDGWYAIEFRSRIGWVFGDVVNLSGPCRGLPVISAPPTPRAVIQPTQAPISTRPPVQSTQPPAGPAFVCNCSKTCTQMASCEEAYYQLRNCGCGRRDGDNDGVPCETICPGG